MSKNKDFILHSLNLSKISLSIVIKHKLYSDRIILKHSSKKNWEKPRCSKLGLKWPYFWQFHFLCKTDRSTKNNRQPEEDRTAITPSNLPSVYRLRMCLKSVWRRFSQQLLNKVQLTTSRKAARKICLWAYKTAC